jgi:hypothetical protein
MKHYNTYEDLLKVTNNDIYDDMERYYYEDMRYRKERKRMRREREEEEKRERRRG